MAEETQDVDLHTKKDPRGLVRQDLIYLKQVFLKKQYTPKTTMQEVMYEEGIQAVIAFIERKMIAKVESPDGFITRG